MKTSSVRYSSHRFLVCCFMVFCCLLFSACQKESFILSSNAQISTSADSLKFDTVFTSIGSVTQFFKINNLNNQKLLFSTVRLMGGPSSPFKININGKPADGANDIEVAANDSLYVFVTVTINPNSNLLPFIVKDSVLIMYNGNSRLVHLEAYGQNANFFQNKIIKVNTTWNSNLPYVISGSMHVDTGATLIINPGCRIYSHADAPFIVDGTLIINGTQQNKVVFNGDRTDPQYKNLPAAWPGIYFRGQSKNNMLQHVVIKNGYQAVVAEQPSVNAYPKVVLHQCIIDNAYDAGLLCVNSNVSADNCLISNCGTNINISLGGTYAFTNCTFAAYSNNYILHKKPVLMANNYTAIGNGTLIADMNALFKNSIFWGDNGSVDNEVVIDKQGNSAFTVLLDHCLYKAKQDPAGVATAGVIKNIDPLFDSIDVAKQQYNFHINNPQAPGINKGRDSTGFLKDLDDNPRNIGLPDIGCYEKQQ